MGFYLLEITVLKCPEVEPRKKTRNKEDRYKYFDFCEKLLPEYAGISQIFEPHPVSNKAYKHHHRTDYDGYKHYNY